SHRGIAELVSVAKPRVSDSRHIFHNTPPTPPTPRRLNDNVSKNSGAGKIKNYPKVDLGDGGGNLSIKTHLNNIWKSVHSIENDIEIEFLKNFVLLNMN
ncbi:17253_t:CDS:1, partial [Acaulospora morrowiae]